MKKITMNRFEQDYKNLISEVISFGTKEKNRTGVDTLVLPNKEIKFSSFNGEIPLITGKKIFYKKALAEFDWIYTGDCNVEYLNQNGVHWWNQYADKNGDLGKTYGYQFRNYNGHFDQLKYCVKEIKSGSRRAYISFWNPSELGETALPCCYTGMKFTLTNNGKVLNASLQFRSSDLFLGLPYDFVFGYLMLLNISELSNKKIGEISYFLSDAHVYLNHIDQCIKYINSNHFDLPNINQAITSNYISGPYIEAKLNN